MDHGISREESSRNFATEHVRRQLENRSLDPQGTNSELPDEPICSRDSRLCRRCEDLHFESRIESMHDFSSTEFDIDMRELEPACKLCQFLEDVYPIASHSPSFTWETPDGNRPLASITFRPRAFVITKTPPRPYGESWPLGIAKANLELLRGMFEHCRANHSKVCGGNRTPVKNIRLVNCITGKSENATAETRYVALSYVWGSPRTGCRLPRTISDALFVAQELGFEYIWVDQLCIDQGSTHKMEQIRQMHNIYQNAELTIVAAAGDDAAYGIPGVNGNLRKARVDFQIGRHHFLEIWRDSQAVMDSTTWSRRGWTYQEKVLSKRLLVFTEREAWFSCCMTGQYRGREHADPNTFKNWVGKGEWDMNFRHFRYFIYPSHFVELVLDYSSRSLTHESDIINAISGILGKLEEAAIPIYHLWGSPIPSSSVRHDGTNIKRRECLVGFALGLDWYSNRCLKRRAGFPSWSWTGWIGKVVMNGLMFYEREFQLAEVSVALELEDSTQLTWSDFENHLRLRNQPGSISRFIHLGAWTIRVRLKDNGNAKYGTSAVVRSTTGEDVLAAVSFDSAESNRRLSEEHMAEGMQREYTGIIISSTKYNSGETGLILLVSDVGQFHERVGLLRLGLETRLESLELEEKQIRLG